MASQHCHHGCEPRDPERKIQSPRGLAKEQIGEHAQRLARQGVHYVVAEPVRVVDDKGEEVPADGETLGEVLMRGNNLMTGYLEEPAQTQETLAGGWYHSGDLAVRHSDDYIEIRDR